MHGNVVIWQDAMIMHDVDVLLNCQRQNKSKHTNIVLNILKI